MKTEQQKQAEKQVKSIDNFITKQKELNPYLFAGLIMKRLLNHCDFSDIEDIAFEMELKFNYKYVKCESLAGEIRLEQFINELQSNPYQLKLIA